MTDLRNLWLSIYLGPAIVYVKRYLWKELTINHNLQDIRPDLYHILFAGGLVFKGKTTEIGNTIFNCTSLVEYNVRVSTDLMTEGSPEGKLGAYNLLRKGLGEQVIAQSIDYMEFMRAAIPNKPETILDICGGDGTYLQLLGDMYESNKCFLMDKDVEAAAYNLNREGSTTRYTVNQHSDPRSYNIPYPYKADLVLLNEVLHLKKRGKWWTECIGTALRNSKPDAHVCIGELLPDVTFDWRMKAMTQDGKRFCIDEFQDFLADHYIKIFDNNFNYIETDTHWFCILRRKR